MSDWRDQPEARELLAFLRANDLRAKGYTLEQVKIGGKVVAQLKPEKCLNYGMQLVTIPAEMIALCAHDYSKKRKGNTR